MDTVSCERPFTRLSALACKGLNASQFIFSIITSGYKLPFIRWPSPVFLENYRMSENERLFVAEAIQELVDNGCAVNPINLSMFAQLRLASILINRPGNRG